MSSRHKDRTSRRDAGEARPLIPERWKHPAAIGGLLLALVIFLFPVIYGGKTFIGPDSIASHSFDTLLKDADDQGIFPLWNPYIFCGMPAYGSLMITGDRWYDFSGWVYHKVTVLFQFLMADSPVGWVVFNYFVFGIGWYLLIYDRLRNSLAAFIGSAAVLFSMFIIIWVMVSHNTKIATLAPFPFLMFIIERLRPRFSLRLSLLVPFLLHFMFVSSHVQMIYYAALALTAYLLVIAFRALRKREPWMHVLRPGAVFAVAAVLAFSMDSDRYLSVLEYNPYSIRGSAPLVQTPGADASKTVEGGLDYDYATQWSLAPGEVMTFLVPTWYGFGHLTYDGPMTTQPIRFNAYWGPQPFTDAAQYMGIVILILAVIGFVRNRRDHFVVYLGIMILFSLLVAFGKEFPALYDPLFSYLPFFNKFRIPSMILVLVQVFVPVLAAYGVHSLMQTRAASVPEKEQKRWTRTILVLAAGVPVVFVLRSPIASFYKSIFPLQEVGGVLARQFGQVQAGVINEFYEFVVNVVVMDIVFAFLFLAVALGAIHYYRMRKITLNVFAAVLIAVVFADLWRIDSRPLDPQPRRDHDAVFVTPPHVTAVLQDSSIYRTLTFQNGQLPYDNTMAYWRVQNAYGYHGAKMRAYQDVVDVVGLQHPLIWQLMNVKYIFSNTPDSSAYLVRTFDGPAFDVYEFTGAFPRAFFVDEVRQAGALEILENIRNGRFDPTAVAYMMDEPPSGIEPPGEGASVVVTHVGIQDVEASIVATGTNAVFFSETWYPEGWKAYLGDEEVPIHRFNYLFRGIVVPPGSHTLRMVLEPAGFALGKTLSLVTNILLIAGFVVVAVITYRKREDT